MPLTKIEDHIENRIDSCATLRRWTANVFKEILKMPQAISEVEFANQVKRAFEENPGIYQEGWYAPPPYGVSALFGTAQSSERLYYDNLRKEENWPKDKYQLADGSAGEIYASPVQLHTGVIGDFGMTVYKGKEPAIQAHLANCLSSMEEAAQYAEMELPFCELNKLTQKLLAERGLYNTAVAITDSTGTNFGHTIPFSYEEPTARERQTLERGNLNEIRNLISTKRVHVNKQEQFKIPANIAFTLEARLKSRENHDLPNTFCHLIICFRKGQRSVLANFNEIFEALGMSKYMHSTYS